MSTLEPTNPLPASLADVVASGSLACVPFPNDLIEAIVIERRIQPEARLAAAQTRAHDIKPCDSQELVDQLHLFQRQDQWIVQAITDPDLADQFEALLPTDVLAEHMTTVEEVLEERRRPYDATVSTDEPDMFVCQITGSPVYGRPIVLTHRAGEHPPVLISYGALASLMFTIEAGT